MRITDEQGHRWPVTGTVCGVCQMPTVDHGPHPSCSPSVEGENVDEVLALLARELGATPDRACIDCARLLPNHAAVGVNVHVRCWMVRPGWWRPGQPSSTPRRTTR